MLARLVLLVLVIIAVSVLWRHLRALRRPPPPRAVDAKTVRCAHCEVYLPSQDAVSRDGQVYCSPDHAARGRRAS